MAKTTAKTGMPMRQENMLMAAADINQVQIKNKEFEQLREFIYLHTGISLADHKRPLVCSRLGKRLRYHGLRNYTDYYKLLTNGDPEGIELLEMINAITTNKTDFFREAHHFQFLTEHVFPAIKQSILSTGRRSIRIWSAGSSTGEEAYTLAMNVLEIFSLNATWDIKILATDIDTNVLKRAQRGIYTREQASKIPQPLLHRYFLKGKGKQEGYVSVKPILKDMIRFRRLNLQDSSWPMREQFDIIFCRNVIIYFDKPTQHRLVARMAGLLKPDGYLMLGHSESLHGVNNDIRHIKQNIYQLAR